MSDERIVEAIADGFVDARNNGVDELEEYAEYVLAALRNDGFEVFRPDEAKRGSIDTVIYDDGPDSGLIYFSNDSRGTHYLVPAEDH